MPLVDQGPGAEIFWNTGDILNFARVLLNDAQGGLSGQILADSEPYTWTLLNLCYDNLADQLEDTNVESSAYAEAIVTLPVSSGSTDPNATCRLGYDGFQDSNGFTYEQPTLPKDMLEPLTIWQRPTGINFPFQRMSQKLGGMESGFTYGAQQWYQQWEFRQNSVYFLGSSFTQQDIRFRYIPSIPLLIQPTGDQPPPVIWFARAGKLLAYMIAAEFAAIRGASNAAWLAGERDKYLQIIANKSAKRQNQTQTRRKGYGFRRGRRNPWV